jgi:hypothetical protein
VKGGVEVLMVSNKHNDGLIFPKGTYVSLFPYSYAQLVY